MGFIQPTFRDITMKTETIQCHIGLAKFGWRFARAQKWFDQTLMSRMYPVMPYRTGQFLGKIINLNAGRYGQGELIVSVPPQGRRLYNGISESGKPFHWTNPNTQPRWATYAYETNKQELKQGVRDILMGRKKD